MIYRLYRGMVIGILACILFSGTVLAQDQFEKVKAVFLFKFFDYTTWPVDKSPQKTGKGYLCTFGPHNFKDTLDYIAARKSNKIRYRAKTIQSPKEAGSCHIVYVARKNFHRIPEFDKGNVLITSDKGSFIEQGGVIEIQQEKEKIKLKIHLGNAKKQNLKISSRLLKIAEIIE